MAPHEFAMGGLYVLVGLVAAWLVRVGWANRDKPGSTGFLLTTAVVATWSVSNGLSQYTAEYGLLYASYGIVQVSAMLASIGWFLLAIEFTGRRSVSRRLLLGLCVIPLVGQLLYWTNGYHFLYFQPGMSVENGILVLEYGVVFWLHSAVGYVMIVVGNAFLAIDALDSRGVRRRQIVVLLAAVIPPLVTNVASLTDFMGIVYDLTPFGFFLTTSLFAYALFRGQFLDVVPVARRTVVDAMDDGLLVLDGDDVVVDANPAARSMLGVDDVEGEPLSSAFEAVPQFLAAVDPLEDGERSITVPGDDGERVLELSVDTLAFPGTAADGRVIVVRDVTPVHRRERELRQREAELDLLRQVITRVFRHDLRNALTIVRLQGGTLANRTDPPAEETAENVLAEAERLTVVSRKAKTVGTLVEGEGPVEQDLVATVAGAVETVHDRYPTLDVATSGPDGCRVVASPALQVAIETLLESAAENEGDAGCLSLTVERGDGVGSVVLGHDGGSDPPWRLGPADARTATGPARRDGAGLSLVDWVIDSSDAGLTVGAGVDGDAVTMSFPLVDAANGGVD